MHAHASSSSIARLSTCTSLARASSKNIEQLNFKKVFRLYSKFRIGRENHCFACCAELFFLPALPEEGESAPAASLLTEEGMLEAAAVEEEATEPAVKAGEDAAGATRDAAAGDALLAAAAAAVDVPEDALLAAEGVAAVGRVGFGLAEGCCGFTGVLAALGPAGASPLYALGSMGSPNESEDEDDDDDAPRRRGRQRSAEAEEEATGRGRGGSTVVVTVAAALKLESEFESEISVCVQTSTGGTASAAGVDDTECCCATGWCDRKPAGIRSAEEPARVDEEEERETAAAEAEEAAEAAVPETEEGLAGREFCEAASSREMEVWSGDVSCAAAAGWAAAWKDAGICACRSVVASASASASGAASEAAAAAMSAGSDSPRGARRRLSSQAPVRSPHSQSDPMKVGTTGALTIG